MVNVLTGDFSSEPSITNITTGCTANVDTAGLCPVSQLMPSFLSCTFIPDKKKKKRTALAMFCCDPKMFPNEICPPMLRTASGYEYVKVGDNCYALKKK